MSASKSAEILSRKWKEGSEPQGNGDTALRKWVHRQEVGQVPQNPTLDFWVRDTGTEEFRSGNTERSMRFNDER